MTVGVPLPERKSTYDSYLKKENMKETCVEFQFNHNVLKKISSPPSSTATSPTASPQESPIFEREKAFNDLSSSLGNSTNENTNKQNCVFFHNIEEQDERLSQVKYKNELRSHARNMSAPELTIALSSLAKEIALMPPQTKDGTIAYKHHGLNYDQRKNTDFLSLNRKLSKVIGSQSYVNMEKEESYNSLRTSEIDPSPHQIEIPSINEILIHTRVCKMLAEYRCVDPTFDFKDLIGVSPITMKYLAQQVDGKKDDLKVSDARFKNMSQSRPILQKLLTCCDDIIVEGYFSSEKVVKEKGKEVEVIILRSDKQRQFIVCYELMSKDFVKAMKKKKNKNLEAMEMETFTHEVKIRSIFHKEYFEHHLESRIFQLLEILLEKHTFYDVVATGHSFGAALATICAVRYANMYPMIRVNCHTFGCPMIGDENWKHFAHSLPNLKIIRVVDKNTFKKESNKDLKVVGEGHVIVLNSPTYVTSCSGDSKTRKTTLVYKFGNGYLFKKTSFLARLPRIRKEKFKSDFAKISEYQEKIELILTSNFIWSDKFVGENVGDGIHGMMNEKRELA